MACGSVATTFNNRTKRQHQEGQRASETLEELDYSSHDDDHQCQQLGHREDHLDPVSQRGTAHVDGS